MKSLYGLLALAMLPTLASAGFMNETYKNCQGMFKTSFDYAKQFDAEKTNNIRVALGLNSLATGAASAVVGFNGLQDYDKVIRINPKSRLDVLKNAFRYLPAQAKLHVALAFNLTSIISGLLATMPNGFLSKQ